MTSESAMRGWEHVITSDEEWGWGGVGGFVGDCNLLPNVQNSDSKCSQYAAEAVTEYTFS